MDINNNDFQIEPTASDNIQPAGKVNFNTSVKNDYSTNEAFKTLRSNLLFSGTDIKTILVTSARENEGKSTVATELSKSLAEIGKKTVLVDADMRKSVILRRNIKSQSINGLSEILSNQATVNNALYSTQIPNFDVIFSGNFPPNPVELLSADNFKNLISTLEEHYDFIIIDCPPLGPVIDAAVVSTCCDGALIVISPGKVKLQETFSVKNQLQKSGCRILGAVLNETDPKNRDRSYGYYKRNNYYYSDNGNRRNNK